jgi:hypothetical protein
MSKISVVSRQILAVVEMSNWFFGSRVTPSVDLNEILQYLNGQFGVYTRRIEVGLAEFKLYWSSTPTAVFALRALPVAVSQSFAPDTI